MTKVGIAMSTLGKAPINGMRVLPVGETSGWYLYCGETLSDAADYFVPIHVAHLERYLPSAIKFLGLPPGYRFLSSGDFLDVWQDEALLR